MGFKAWMARGLLLVCVFGVGVLASGGGSGAGIFPFMEFNNYKFYSIVS